MYMSYYTRHRLILYSLLGQMLDTQRFSEFGFILVFKVFISNLNFHFNIQTTERY